MKWVRRILATLGALTILLTLVSVPKASAEIYRERGKVCAGVKVKRCAYVNIDTSRDPGSWVRAYGAVRNKVFPGLYTVHVSRVVLQSRLPGGAWETDLDDRFNRSDPVHLTVGNNGLYGYSGGWYVRAKAHLMWTGGASGAEWVTSTPVYVG